MTTSPRLACGMHDFLDKMSRTGVTEPATLNLLESALTGDAKEEYFRIAEALEREGNSTLESVLEQMKAMFDRRSLSKYVDLLHAMKQFDGETVDSFRRRWTQTLPFPEPKLRRTYPAHVIKFRRLFHLAYTTCRC